MYAPEYFPGYLSGIAYLIHTSLIPQLLQVSLTVPMIHMDDVYVTGILAKEIGLRLQDSPLFTFTRTDPHACNSKTKVSELGSVSVLIMSVLGGISYFELIPC
jgi:hypothetical protein